MKYLFIAILSVSAIISVTGQIVQDSGFNDKSQAKNLTVNGLKEGKWVYYSREHDVTTDSNAGYYIFYSLIVYKADKQIGVSRMYYRSGKLCSETPYSNGKKNGVEKWYYPSGKLKKEVPYVDDYENGTQKNYYENGNIKSELPWVNGEISGMVKNYDEDGEKIK